MRLPVEMQEAHAHLPRRSFFVRYLTLFAGEAFSKLCVLAAFAYLARVLGPRDLGVVELALSVTVFFVLGVESGMGLYGARVVAAAADRIPRLVPQVMLLRALLGLPAYALLLGVATTFQSSGLGLLAVYGGTVLLTPFLTQWVFQGLRQMQWVATGAAIRNFVFVALVLVLIRPGSDLRLVAVAEVAGVAAIAVFNTLLLHRRLGIRLDWTALGGTRRLLSDVWPLGVGDFTWACLWYAPGVITGWMGLASTEQVAWIAAAVRIVLSLHTFVFLYFFNLLPNLSRELSVGLAEWRQLMARSMSTAMWPAGLIAVLGTLAAPLLMPLVFGPPYVAAVRPFQIAIWMIPVTWFSGHFRFSLIAAGQQRAEFGVSAASALVTIVSSVVFVHDWGSSGAAAALLTGGIVNAALAVATLERRVGPVSVLRSIGPALLACASGLVGGLVVSSLAGSIAGAAASVLIWLAVAGRHLAFLFREGRQLLGR